MILLLSVEAAADLVFQDILGVVIVLDKVDELLHFLPQKGSFVAELSVPVILGFIDVLEADERSLDFLQLGENAERAFAPVGYCLCVNINYYVAAMNMGGLYHW